MKTSHKKTWLIYYALIGLGSLLLVITISSKYDKLLSEKKHEQLYTTKIVSSDIDTLFLKYEIILDLISEDFSKNNSLNQAVVANILEKSDLLVGFNLFNTDGSLRDKSNNLPNNVDYNLKPEKHVYTWFKNGLQQNEMMIHKPTYYRILDKWIIPFQKRLLDSNGNVIGVLASAIDLEKLEQKWPRSKAFGNNVELTLDQNFYQLLHLDVGLKGYQMRHNNPFTFRQMDSTKKQLEKQNLNLDKLRERDDLVAQIIVEIGGNKILTSIVYSKNYQFWTHSSRSLDELTEPFLSSIVDYIVLFISLVTIAFFLFRWIVKTEESKLSELTYKSQHDDLTGCYNRSVLSNLVKNIIKSHKQFSLLYIDLDNFKNINDSFGHQYGDILLKEVSRRIQKSLDKIPGSLVRYSGDEFILLLENSDKKTIRHFTSELLNDLAKFHSIHNNSFSVTSSIGITRYPADAKTLDTLISYAENSMAIAKKTKNQYLFFSQKVHQKLIKQAQIEHALHNAIDANEISLVYQPQLDSEQKLYGVEALVRWHSKDLGFIPPDLFIPIAEETGLMPKLGQYIMNTAMAEISTLQARLGSTFALSINVSVRQFVQVNFFELLMASIANFGSEKLPITIEITESLFIESIEVLLPIFIKMKANNISLALDDFGTGYSSLSMLREAPIDELKIDKSFVDHITSSDTDKAMVKSIIGMGKNLNMRVLAEGVETESHTKILQESGCDLFQGYYFSQPLKVKELETFIKELKVKPQV